MFDESVYRKETSQKMQMNQKFIEKSELREMLVTPKLFFFEGCFFFSPKGFKTSHMF